MKIPRLIMESQSAKIGIQQKKTMMDIHQPKADMQIEQPKADFAIHTKKGKLTIDQTQAWEETNIKSPLRWTEIFAQDGKEAAKAGAARRAEQGAELIDIHLSQHTIGQQAIVNGHPQMKNLSITYIPSPFSVKISYQPSEVQINIKANQPIIRSDTKQPEINAKRGGADIYMERYADLTIEVDQAKHSSILV